MIEFLTNPWVLVVLFWAFIAAMFLWGWSEWKSIDEPHTYDDRLARREADIAKAEAEAELQHRPRVRAGRTL